MIVDFDDFHQGQHRLDLLEYLRDANPDFRCTLFAIPAHGSDEFWEGVPEWCELAVHGWNHWSPREAEDWSYDVALGVLNSAHPRFTHGFKAPGWQISDDTYQVINELGWWVADHWENDGRRPRGTRVHVITQAAGAGTDPKHWHGHIQNVCGNGLEETFDTVLERVAAADKFELISEVVKRWR